MHHVAKVRVTDIHMDAQHSRAICVEIGWRLRAVLSEDRTALPPRLQSLLDRFVEMDLEIEAPPLVPGAASLDARVAETA